MPCGLDDGDASFPGGRIRYWIVSERSGALGEVCCEAEYARGLGNSEVLCCRSDRFDEVHFDARNRNHIVRENRGDLRTAIQNRNPAAIGEGPGQSMIR